MRTTLLLLTPFTLLHALYAQNLVPNPSFEDSEFCKTEISGETAGQGADEWDSYRGSTDYFNTCNSWNLTQLVGAQTASSGSGFAGFYAYYGDIPDSREVIGAKLFSPLVIGEQYFVSLKFSLAEKYPDTGVNHLGVLFLTKGYSSTNEEAPGTCPTCLNYLPNHAHAYTTFIIAEYAGWFEVSGYFTADSSYTHIAIGNFADDSNTQTQVVFPENQGKNASYYFVDDVVVRPVSFLPPAVELGKDTTLCPGQTLTLGVTAPYALSYRWQDNSTASTFQVTESGIYWVKVNNAGIQDIDSLTVNYIEELDLGNDTLLCEPSVIQLTANVPDATYLWQDSTTQATFDVTQTGIYWVNINEPYCGEQVDSISVSIEDCQIILDIPNVFSPNGDGYNEIFTPKKINGITSMTTSIYNRWGKQVFASSEFTIGWSGNIDKERDVPSGIYYWMIYYTDRNGDRRHLKGIVSLLR